MTYSTATGTATDTGSSATTTVTTPTVRRSLRRWLLWIAAIALAVLVTVVSLAVVRDSSAGTPLAADSPTPTGAKALVQVLRQQGVTVVEAPSLDAMKRASTDGAAVLLYDPESYLDETALQSVRAASNDIVLISPNFTALHELAPGVAQAGEVSGVRTAGCSLAAARNAGTVVSDGMGYRLTGASGVGCFSARGGVYSVVRVAQNSATTTTTTTVVGTTTAFDNGHIATKGNAALALNLLGERSRLVWYLPTAADAPGGSAPDLADLTPPWLTSFLLLGVLTAIAAAVWRGRRFGALVIENLPVTVRASETMEGRARLYAASGARLHALDALRIGTLERVARVLGLPQTVGVDEIVSAAASVTGTAKGDIADLLVDGHPATDAELVRLSDQLLRFEATLTAALRPHQSGSDPEWKRMNE